MLQSQNNDTEWFLYEDMLEPKNDTICVSMGIYETLE